MTKDIMDILQYGENYPDLKSRAISSNRELETCVQRWPGNVCTSCPAAACPAEFPAFRSMSRYNPAAYVVTYAVLASPGARDSIFSNAALLEPEIDIIAAI